MLHAAKAHQVTEQMVADGIHEGEGSVTKLHLADGRPWLRVALSLRERAGAY